MKRVRLVWSGLCLGCWIGGGLVAEAGTVRGQLTVAADRNDPTSEGLWRVENGLLPVAARPIDLRSECLIVLLPRSEGRGREMKKEEPVAAELRGLRLLPQVIALPLGAALEVKNEDRVPHSLWARSGDELVLPPRATPAGEKRTEKLQRPGTYEVRDEEQPHLRGWIIVTDGAHTLRTDERGAFRGEIPDGPYTLKVFARGGFVLERSVEVSAKMSELTLHVPAPEPRGGAR